MKLFPVVSICCAMLVAGCNAASVKPDAEPQPQQPEQAAAQAPVEKPDSQAPGAAPKPASVNEQVDMIARRMTAVQEHVLQLKTQNMQLQQQNQIVSTQLKELKNLATELVTLSASLPAAGEQPQSEDFSGVLDQITMMANELGSQVQDGAFRITSIYTAKGQWVLIRYHRYSGETWLADQGQWNLLEESGSTGTAEYEVRLSRADKDVKGYVAARVDRINGTVWWLKQNTWQPYESN